MRRRVVRVYDEGKRRGGVFGFVMNIVYFDGVLIYFSVRKFNYLFEVNFVIGVLEVKVWFDCVFVYGLIDVLFVVFVGCAFFRDGNFLIWVVDCFGEFDSVKLFEWRIWFVGNWCFGVYFECEDLIRDVFVNGVVR